MQVTRFDSALSYDALAHFGMAGLQLQGGAVSSTSGLSVSLSHFLPGGGAEHRASPTEKVYVVIEGTIIVRTDDVEAVLERFDSVHLAPGEARSIINQSNQVATMVVVVLPPSASTEPR